MSVLAASPSPFLRHGAEQPVAWLPWSADAFERARELDRPILLDIGAVWCHWCHVMDNESYENPATAALINEQFVAVKVDRDERPDVDARYQRAVQALSGQGGWPLTAFLTPDGEAFYGGTYFPPDDRYGRPSFPRVLSEIARIWHEDREQAAGAARQVAERLSAYAGAEAGAGRLEPALVDAVVEGFAESFDFRHGGFGTAPKFPNGGALELLLDRWLDRGEEWARRVVDETLRGMARGGIRDHLGGGFHRYSVDARWNVPHFEKMSYDNAALLEAYARAYAALGDDEWRDVCRGVVDYYLDIAPELLEQGGFPASQDADVGAGDDGAYWTWTLEEARAAIDDDDTAEAAALRFGLRDARGAMHEDPQRHVLFLALTVDEVAHRLEREPTVVAAQLEEAARRMKTARDRRARPYVDDTVYSGWSAMLASAFIAADRYAGDERALPIALRALERIHADRPAADGVPHRVGDPDAGFYLEDQALVARAYLDAFEATQDVRWLDRARALAQVALARYRDDDGAFLDRPAEEAAHGLLAQPFRPITDAPVPAGNSVMALVLARLGVLDDARWTEEARRTLAAFAAAAPRLGTMVATWARAVAWIVAPASTLVVVDDTRGELWRAARAAHRPRTVLRRFEPAAVEPGRLPEALRAMVTGDAPRAYLCAGAVCAAPVATASELLPLLRDFRG
ncbi:MAG TPA: thioredoxin domain-containing protein [Longimicrobiales bacterium]|nr:thioredoxin domain-containing protein [Longimicrobiales bacterium]